MSDAAHHAWLRLNKECLIAALDDVRHALESTGLEAAPAATWHPGSGRRPALDELCERLALSPFERRVLLLAAGMELDSRFPALCTAMRPAGGPEGASLALALALFKEAHWSALAPTAPLRHWHLVELGEGNGLVQRPLSIDEYVLDYLLGQERADPGLPGLTETLPADPLLAPSQAALAERIAAIWREAQAVPPVIQLSGGAAAAVATKACDLLGKGWYVLAAAALPTEPAALERVIRLCERHARLTGSVLVLLADQDDTTTNPARFVERLDARLVVVGPGRPTGRRPSLRFEVHKPTAAEQYAQWLTLLADLPDAAADARQLAAQFHLEPAAIEAVHADARARQTLDAPAERRHAVWDAARQQARPKLDGLAQRIEPRAGWSDLVLPEPQMQMLRAIVGQMRHGPTVYQDWGFAARSERGLGLAALFTGSSGTGKTTAAEVIAGELRLDLYRVDLGAVVSKYIGETEKNLGRIFDAAEEGGAGLLFDEADALFGKRTEVTDSHDRHANIEVSYLLQRIETFRGLALLTTNMKASLDNAFLRRLRFIVTFPFPDAALRARIWRRIFPAATPTDGLDPDRLAQLALSGGQIQAIALNAAFLAAEAGQAVGMAHIRTAARLEYAKQEKNLSDAELKGWPP